jgi:putative pyruvate formate lyase activating enzyme
MWEEPCISGTRGSGTIFFCGCNLSCLFCQNHAISHGAAGVQMDAGALADCMLQLQAQGAHNINLVTPAPHVPVLCKAIPMARQMGLRLPIVYNTNAYERVETLRRLEGFVDIYLPDIKYVTPVAASRYSGAGDYFEYASKAVLEMQRQCGVLRLNPEGIAVRGLLVRHLVLPGSVDEARRVLGFIAKALPQATHISLMGQYMPCHKASFAPLNRKLLRREYERAIEHCVSLGFTNVLIQSLSSADSAFVPPFAAQNEENIAKL